MFLIPGWIGVVAIAVAVLDTTIATVFDQFRFSLASQISAAFHCVGLFVEMAARAICAFALYILTAATTIWDDVIVFLGHLDSSIEVSSVPVLFLNIKDGAKLRRPTTCDLVVAYPKRRQFDRKKPCNCVTLHPISLHDAPQLMVRVTGFHPKRW